MGDYDYAEYGRIMVQHMQEKGCELVSKPSVKDKGGYRVCCTCGRNWPVEALIEALKGHNLDRVSF